MTWKPGASQHTLKSEKEVLDAAEDNLVTIEKTRIVLNCPVLYTDTGGLLTKAQVYFTERKNEDKR